MNILLSNYCFGLNTDKYLPNTYITLLSGGWLVLEQIYWSFVYICQVCKVISWAYFFFTGISLLGIIQKTYHSHMTMLSRITRVKKLLYIIFSLKHTCHLFMFFGLDLWTQILATISKSKNEMNHWICFW